MESFASRVQGQERKIGGVGLWLAFIVGTTFVISVAAHAVAADAKGKKGDRPVVVFSMAEGDITIELYPDKAPVTVKNFLQYVESGFYDGTIFHRVIPDFVIQGGGYTETLEQKPTQPPIKNEADNGLKNERGTLSMARTSDINSATSQFFINLKDNDFLDHGTRDFGYAVFGKVIEGMDVVEKIAAKPTTNRGPFQDTPVTPIVTQKAEQK